MKMKDNVDEENEYENEYVKNVKEKKIVSMY